MRTTDRTHALIAVLRRPGGATPAELSEALGIPERFVHAELADLVDAGVPIDGSGGRFFVRDDALVELGACDADEVAAVIVALERAVRFRGEPVATAAARVLDRLARRASPERREGPTRGTCAADRDARERELHDAWRDEIERAASERRCIRLRYSTIGRSSEERVVQPLGFHPRGCVRRGGPVPSRGRDSFVAWCRLREDFRRFRVDRIEALHVLDERFPVTAGREWEDFAGGTR